MATRKTSTKRRNGTAARNTRKAGKAKARRKAK